MRLASRNVADWTTYLEVRLRCEAEVAFVFLSSLAYWFHLIDLARRTMI